MQKLSGTIELKPQLDDGRTYCALKMANGNTVECISGPGFDCPTLNGNAKVILYGDYPRDIVRDENSRRFSFSEVER